MDKPAANSRPQVEMLDRLNWARKMNLQQLEHLSGYMDREIVEAGKTIFSEGDAADFMAIVAEGEVEVVKLGSRNQARVLAVLGAGHAFGEMALIDGEARSATIRARGRVTLFKLKATAFEQLLRDRPGVGMKLLLMIARAMSRRLRNASLMLVDTLDEGEHEQT